MAIITLRFNPKNSLAVSIINSIKQAGVFEITEEKKQYSEEFVKKIETSEKQFKEGNYKKIVTDDLWK